MRVADLGEAQLRNNQYAEETERAQRVVAEKESATFVGPWMSSKRFPRTKVRTGNMKWMALGVPYLHTFHIFTTCPLAVALPSLLDDIIV